MFILKSLLMIVEKNKEKDPKYRNLFNKKMCKVYSIVLMQV